MQKTTIDHRISYRDFSLKSLFSPTGDQPAAIKSLTQGVQKGHACQTLLGVTGSGKTFTIANVIKNTGRPVLVLAPNKTLAAQLYGEFKSFFPNNAVEYFVSYYDYYQPEAYVPSSDLYIEKDASVNEHIEQMRLAATKALLERRDVIIVATVSAIYGLGDPTQYLKMMLKIEVGEKVNQREILKRLADMQYSRNEVELFRGNYRVRGENVEIFPAESEFWAVRIEMFDDDVEGISWFDPLNGRVESRINEAMIYPKTHYVTPHDRLVQMLQSVKDELRDRLQILRDNDRLVEAQRLEERTRLDMEMVRELGYCSGIENYSRYLSGRSHGEAPPTLFDYLPEDALLIVDESHLTLPQLGGMYKGDHARKSNLIEYGFRLPSAIDNRPLRFEEFEERRPQSIFVSATPGDYEHLHSIETVEQLIRPTGLIDPKIEVRPALSQVDDLYGEIKDVVSRGERVLIITLTKRMAEDLTDYYSANGVAVRYLHSDIDTVERVEIIRDLRMGRFDVLVGINLLREGLDMPEVSVVAILDADKEGFLRSERSLIQTIGRVARNLNGKAILYADKITNSMRRAMDETERRRRKQHRYNLRHNITPKTVVRDIRDEMEGAHNETERKVADTGADYHRLSPVERIKFMRKLEKQMYRFARDLEFEQAAQLRNQIQELRALGLDELVISE